MAMSLSEFAKKPLHEILGYSDKNLVNNTSARIQYLYRCSECPEETWHSSPDLHDCPYCRHALLSPQRVDMEELPEIIGVPHRRPRGGCGDIS